MSKSKTSTAAVAETSAEFSFVAHRVTGSGHRSDDMVRYSCIKNGKSVISLHSSITAAMGLDKGARVALEVDRAKRVFRIRPAVDGEKPVYALHRAGTRLHVKFAAGDVFPHAEEGVVLDVIKQDDRQLIAKLPA